MKKFIGFGAALAIAASSLVICASAAGYAIDPEFTLPSDTEGLTVEAPATSVDRDLIHYALAKDATIYIADDAVLDADALTFMAGVEGGAAVTFTADDYKVKVDGANITTIEDIDLSIDVVAGDDISFVANGSGLQRTYYLSVDEEMSRAALMMGGEKIGNAMISADQISVTIDTAGEYTIVNQPYALGDIDDTIGITGTDASLLARYLVDYKGLTDEQLSYADFDLNGEVAIEDLVKLKKFIVDGVEL